MARINIITKASLLFALVPGPFVFVFIENETFWWTLVGALSFVSCLIFCAFYDQPTFDSSNLKFKFKLFGYKIIAYAMPSVLLSIFVFIPFLFLMILVEEIVSIGSGLVLISFIITSFKMFRIKIIPK